MASEQIPFCLVVPQDVQCSDVMMRRGQLVQFIETLAVQVKNHHCRIELGDMVELKKTRTQARVKALWASSCVELHPGTTLHVVRCTPNFNIGTPLTFLWPIHSMIHEQHGDGSVHTYIMSRLFGFNCFDAEISLCTSSSDT